MNIKVMNISKKIKDITILNNISIEMTGGKVYGFVGRNGSGKTMLFRALSGLMKVDIGEIEIDGKYLNKDLEMIPNLGIVLENAGLYPEFTGLKNLQLLAQINKKINNQKICEAIKRVGLNPDDKRTVRKYSLGMKQRIVIAQAIMESPDILFLDEPTNALDESGIEMIRNIILEEKKRGALILIASHNKEDIEVLADSVYFMENGTIIERVEKDEQ